MARKKRRPKKICEVCGKNDVTLHRHHIIPRVDPRSTNTDDNIIIVCPNDHSLIHSGEIIVIGVYQTSNGFEPLWFKKGEESPLAEKYWKVVDNPLVITLKAK